MPLSSPMRGQLRLTTVSRRSSLTFDPYVGAGRDRKDEQEANDQECFKCVCRDSFLREDHSTDEGRLESFRILSAEQQRDILRRVLRII